MQQRLGRDAADIEAHAAERGFLLDQHHLLAEVGSAERGGVAAGAGAEHDDFGVDVAFGNGGVLGTGMRELVAQLRGDGCAGASCRFRQIEFPFLSLAFQHQDHRAFADLVAHLDLDLLSPRRRRGTARPPLPCRFPAK